MSKRSNRRYDSYSKPSIRPLSIMSVDPDRHELSPYTMEQQQHYEYDHVDKNRKQQSRLKREAMKTFAPDLDDDEIDDRLHNHTYCPNGHSDSGGIPLFIILITLGQVGYFIYMYKFQYPESTDLTGWNSKFNDDPLIFTGRKTIQTQEYWRFFTYSFVHCGLSHLIGNVSFQLLIGIPLEYVHGSFRVGILYCVGVIVGSMTALIVTPQSALVGASGGDFCLVSAVLANCLLNCDSMNKAIAAVRFITMGGYIGYEVYSTIQRWTSGSSISWAAHMGGAVTGLFLGVVVLRNREKKGFERCFSAIGLVAFLGYVVALILVWFMIMRDNEIENAIDVFSAENIQATSSPKPNIPAISSKYEDIITITEITFTYQDGTREHFP